MHLFLFLAANMDVTQKSFAFPLKHNIPLYYVSASDGTNVVKVTVQHNVISKLGENGKVLKCRTVVPYYVAHTLFIYLLLN